MKIVQMNVAERERDLHHQRRERQQRTVPLVAVNPVHLIPTTNPMNMLALLKCLARGEGSFHLVEDQSR